MVFPLTIAALRMQPLEPCDQFRGQLDAFRVDTEAATVDFAFAGDHIEIAAGCLGVEDSAVVILNLFKTAETALLAFGFPRFGCGSFITFLGFLHKSPSSSRRAVLN